MNQDVNSLQLPATLVQELKKLGLNNTKDVDAKDKQVKSKLPKSTWLKAVEVPKIQTALDLYEEECLLGNILTFHKELDVALGGGLGIGQITEFVGEPGSGKTQLCLQLCVNIQLPTWCGGAEGEAVYICTNSNFSSQRLKDYAQDAVQKYKSKIGEHPQCKGGDITVDDILKRVHYIKCTDYIELCAITIYLKRWLQNYNKVRLVIIDSISLPFKFLERVEKNNVIYSFLTNLQILSMKYKLTIVFTNDLTTGIKLGGKTNTAFSLGGSYYHRINTRIELKKKAGNIFEAKIVKCVKSPNISVKFQLCC